MDKAVSSKQIRRVGIGPIETIIRVYHLGREMHPDLNLNSIKHQVNLLVKTIKFLPDIRKWFDIQDNPILLQALKRFNLMNGAIYWPYINNIWSMKQKLSTIDTHYRMLVGNASIIAQATFEEVELVRLDEQYAGLRLVLDKAKWFLREGEIVLNLFVNDERYYSIAFTLGYNDGEPIVFVGAIQGSNSDAAQTVYRDLTHALNGMRPRDFLMVALKLICCELGIHKIWAVSTEHRQLNTAYFGEKFREKVHVSYDEVWLEHLGKELNNGFFEIPTVVSYKEMSEIPSRKRAAYRRRYEMLDKLALVIKSSCRRTTL
jgi:uncharacterized protein VirK/YbjX